MISDSGSQAFPFDGVILNNLASLNAEEIHQKVSESQKTDFHRITKRQVAERIKELLYNFDGSNASQFFGADAHEQRLPLSSEEEFVSLLLSRYLKEKSPASLIQSYRNLFRYCHPFNSLVSSIGQGEKMSNQRVSTVIEHYATHFAQMERIYDIKEFSDEELAEVGLDYKDLEFIEDIQRFAEDNSVPDSRVHINENDDDEGQEPIEEIESEYIMLTQQINAMILASLSNRTTVIPINVKNFLFGDFNLNNDVDFSITDIEEYTTKREEKLSNLDDDIDDMEEMPLVMIMLKNDLNFYITNYGISPIKVNGFQIWTNEVTYLNDSTLLEIGGCSFIFKINWLVINRLSDEYSKMNNQNVDENNTM